jgi:hypothetical protein
MPIDYQAKARKLRAQLKQTRIGASECISRLLGERYTLTERVSTLESQLTIANAMLAERRDDDFADAVRFATMK